MAAFLCPRLVIQEMADTPILPLCYNVRVTIDIPVSLQGAGRTRWYQSLPYRVNPTGNWAEICVPPRRTIFLLSPISLGLVYTDSPRA